MLNDLKERGVEEPKIIVTDGLNGMEEAMHQVYPNSRQQRCLVHIARNIAKKVNKKDRQVIIPEFKEAYSSNTREEAEDKLDKFLNKWCVTYPRLDNLYKLKLEMFAYYDFPKSIWKNIYTSNPIEAFNSYAKRELRKRIQMNNEDFCLRIMTTISKQYNNACKGGRNRLFERMNDDEKELMGFKLTEL